MANYAQKQRKPRKDAQSLNELYGDIPKQQSLMQPNHSDLDQFERMQLANNPKAAGYKERANQLKMEALATQNHLLKMKV